jgi:hypothetical protein
LKTIKISKNLLVLKDKLPKPNYSLPKINNKNMNQTKLNSINNFQSETLSTANNIANKTNRINTVGTRLNIFTHKSNSNNINFDILSIKKMRINSDPKEINTKNKIRGLYNLYSSQRNKIIPKIKNNEEKKNVVINNKKSNKDRDKRIFDTYKIYLSKDMRKFLIKNKRYKLPKINTNSIIK